MNKMIDDTEEFETLDKDTKEEDINWLYGGQQYYITKEQIEALLKGKKLYATINYEYAFTIEIKEVEDETI